MFPSEQGPHRSLARRDTLGRNAMPSVSDPFRALRALDMRDPSQGGRRDTRPVPVAHAREGSRPGVHAP